MPPAAYSQETRELELEALQRQIEYYEKALEGAKEQLQAVESRASEEQREEQ
jgi:hypothetical protein